MQNRIYYDTNIFLDLLDLTRPHAKDSLDLSKKLLSEGKALYINSDTITNSFYVLNRTKAYEQIKILEKLKKAISLFYIVAIEYKEVLEAIKLCEDKNNSFTDYEDALQYICAKKADADFIVTNDKSFINLDIKVIKSCEYE